MATVPELEVKGKRTILRLVRRDINQLHNVGHSVVEKSDASLKDSFLSMYPSLTSLRDQYMSSFNDILSDCMIKGQESLFPVEEDYKYRTEVNTLYYKVVQYYQKCTKPTETPGSNFSSNTINQTMISRSRLPKITLPKFSGIISEWPKYKQLFESMVHSNPDVPEIEKFHYLSTSLAGEPLTLIAPLTITEENYPKAWETLTKRFDNKRLLATSYIDKILEFSPQGGPPTLSSLQSFITTISENIASFKSVSIEDEADFLLLTLALKKLDPETRKQFEISSVNVEWPTYNQLVDFIHGRRKVMQLSEPYLSEPPRASRNPRPFNKGHILATTSSPGQPTCSCKPSHFLYECSSFRSRSANGRKAYLKGKLICFNCLKPGHINRNCGSPRRCSVCKGRHHTLLHTPQPQGSQSSTNQPLSAIQPSTNFPPTVIASVTRPSQVLLGTAMAIMIDQNGRPQPVRVVIDCCSQFSLVTADCVRRLGLSWSSCHHKPLGVCETPVNKVKGQLTCKLQSKLLPQHSFDLNLLVVPSISGHLPTSRLNPIKPDNPFFKILADPDFHEPKHIDVLCGGDVFMKILTGSPTKIDDIYEALPTVFGLIPMGNVNATSTELLKLHCRCLTDSPISDDLVTKFWETEEIVPVHIEPPSDPCEEHYAETHYRNSEGRYVVALPFKESTDGLESSRFVAAQQFKSLEVRMDKNPLLKSKYTDFMKEYQDLGHMSPAKTPPAYVIPHHGVFRNKDPDSKIRVVFNASSCTANGSLNDKLYTGPKLQSDLTLIVLNFRRHRIAVTEDIVKMYRQILIRPEDRRFLNILWRTDPKGEAQTYELNTVTYGVKCAPYQAIRTIKQLVSDEGEPYPVASKVLIEDMYVDDIVSGAATVEEELVLKEKLTSLLGAGKFEIHKWASNSPELLKALGHYEASQPLDLAPKDTCVAKILGMVWDPSEDTFLYHVNQLTPGTIKGAILSVIARLFDPMGFISPIIFRAKTIHQSLWKAKIDWDEQPDETTTIQWLDFTHNLHMINHIRIPRFVLSINASHFQVIGFCDASLKGFAAVLYLRVVNDDKTVKVSLLKSKTKLSPLKPTKTVPHLELSAAHLLVKLLLSVKSLLDSLNVVEILLYSDSTITLGWINQSPHLFQTFVANRISFIISHTQPSSWYHVSTHDNPADIASRGTEPHLLKHHALWWAGPSWLKDPLWSPESPTSYETNLPDIRSGGSLVMATSTDEVTSWIATFSSYRKLVRVMSYVNRILHFYRHHSWSTGPLTADEMESSLQTLFRITQRFEFHDEFSWETNQPKSKRLLILAAFKDESEVLRVGGRLENSHLPVIMKFPIILPSKCHLTHLIIDHMHAVNFHMGHHALLALIRRKFWIFRLRQTIKDRINKCLTCFKGKARPQPPIMGNLPDVRVTPSRPFSQCGVDYAGPFLIKTSQRRNAPVTKAYLCLFLCLATRAVHLEIVSSLSTESFLATLDRFVARRGRPRSMYSDNGTNFVGASRRLKELFSWMRCRKTQEDIQNRVADLEFNWSFNPPHAPHFGGIWEAAIRSAKTHLYKVSGDRIFNYEELTTIFTRIESILNSRPMCSSDNGGESDYLTPGHFLIGAPLLAMPERDITDVNMNRLSRWQLVSNSVQHFWKRWHIEYLHTLQKRPKWYHHTRPLKPGDLVFIADSASAPLLWKKARITECFPGRDGITRVVSVKDHKGIRKLPVHNLVSLSHLSEPQVVQD